VPVLARHAHVTGNSSADRTKIQIWTCNDDNAQRWTTYYTAMEHNGMCMNDKAGGGSGSPVILWKCNRATNELWTHLANGELVLHARNYTLCLDDPAYSTRNGTQLIVYTCKDSPNQRWYTP
jgi:Ricin-type beta-trefoil lectin domain